jgi:UDP-GlcNAc:undecaprenyl-phosphate GlcNAc-1-phosphate transferase
MIYFITFVAALLIALILTPVVRGLALRAKVMDIPNQRSLHDSPRAKVGGIAIYFAFILPLIWFSGSQMFWVIAGATIVLLFGFFDDLMNISPLTKFVGQFAAAAILIAGGIKIGYFPDVISIPLTLFWMVGIMNAVNLLDGMDGLAAGASAVMALVFMVLALQRAEPQIALVSAALAGACLGFLRYNFYKASIFMGDTGSLFLGFILASLGVMITAQNTNLLHLFVPVIILGIPIFDTLLAVVRRIWKRKSLFDADCDHFYEWLWNNRIFGYRTVVVMTYFACMIFGLGALFIGGM